MGNDDTTTTTTTTTGPSASQLKRACARVLEEAKYSQDLTLGQVSPGPLGSGFRSIDF